jgi:hypothetical protein
MVDSIEVPIACILDFPLLATYSSTFGLVALRSKSVISAIGTLSLLPLVGNVLEFFPKTFRGDT